MLAAADLLEQSEALLLDFDGPVCKVFTRVDLRDAVAEVLETLGFSDLAGFTSAEQTDPLEVLRWVGRHRAELIAEAEHLVINLELRGVEHASPTAGIVRLLETCGAANRPVAFVSNNSPDCIESFVRSQGGEFRGIPILGRLPCQPEQMKPEPSVLERGLKALGRHPGDSVLLGDSVSDVVAARRAGVRCIAFVNKPHKEPPLREAGPDALIHSLEELVS